MTLKRVVNGLEKLILSREVRVMVKVKRKGWRSEDVLRRVEEARSKCGAFGGYDIFDIECYVCEREDRELSKFCKEVKKAGGLVVYLERVLGGCGVDVVVEGLQSGEFQSAVGGGFIDLRTTVEYEATEPKTTEGDKVMELRTTNLQSTEGDRITGLQTTVEDRTTELQTMELQTTVEYEITELQTTELQTTVEDKTTEPQATELRTTEGNESRDGSFEFMSVTSYGSQEQGNQSNDSVGCDYQTTNSGCDFYSSIISVTNNTRVSYEFKGDIEKKDEKEEYKIDFVSSVDGGGSFEEDNFGRDSSGESGVEGVKVKGVRRVEEVNFGSGSGGGVVSSELSLDVLLRDERFKVVSVDDYVEVGVVDVRRFLEGFVERSLEEAGKYFRRRSGRMWFRVQELLRGVYKHEYEGRYGDEYYRSKLKKLIEVGFVFVRLRDSGGIWFQLIYLGDRF